MNAAAQAPLPEEDSPAMDALADLEDRIRKAVDLLTTLRAERDAAVAELAAARDAAGTALTDSQKNHKELEALRADRKELDALRLSRKELDVLRVGQKELDSLRRERKEVRVRIEKLLEQMDQL
jgi:hypothetical protein